jgi:thioredoxin-related protein
VNLLKMIARAAAALAVIFASTMTVAAGEDSVWLTNLDHALAKAKAEGKYVLVDFGGSDWCPPCKRLQAEVFDQKEFKEFASTNLILVDIDFPQTRKQSAELQRANQKLADKYNVEIFPTVMLFNEKGKKVFRESGYSGMSLADYVEKLRKQIKR